MTGAQYCRESISGREAVMPFPDPKPREFLVRFSYSLAGEPARIAEHKPKAFSEAGAIRAAIVKELGRVNRTLHTLVLSEVRAL